jgi:hypothetical protein
VGRPNFLDEAVNTWNRIGSMGSIPNPLLRSTPWPDIATCLCRRTGGLHRRPELFPRAYALEESPGRRVPGMAPFASPSAAGLSTSAASATARRRQPEAGERPSTANAEERARRPCAPAREARSEGVSPTAASGRSTPVPTSMTTGSDTVGAARWHRR